MRRSIRGYVGHVICSKIHRTAILTLGRERLADFDWSLAPKVYVLERSQE